MPNKDKAMSFLYINDYWGNEAWKHNPNQSNTWVSMTSQVKGYGATYDGLMFVTKWLVMICSNPITFIF